jgi:hypothetical protein
MKQMRFLPGRRRWFQLAGIALAAALAAGLWYTRPGPKSDLPRTLPGTAAAAIPSIADPALAPAPAPTTELRNWIAEYRAAEASGVTADQRQAWLTRGSSLAAARREHLLQLIRENPRQALALALRFDEYQALPAQLRALVERPFCAAASFSLLPVCAGSANSPGAAAPTADHLALLSLPDGSTPAAFTYGQRLHLTSKRALPVSGIVLDGCAAVAEGVFRAVAAQERATVLEQFPSGQPDLSRSFATGLPLNGPGLFALAAGRVFAFSGPEEMAQLDSALSALDSRPGPDSGSSLLLASATLPAGPDGVFNLAAAQTLADQLASAWTETRKKVFLIRVDFADDAGEPVSQPDAANLLNGTTSATIRAMSYNKTWIEGGVSANVYRLPQTAANYAGKSNPAYGQPGFSSLNSELLRDARNIFRSSRSGADASINLGPSSTTGTGGDAGLGDFDVVGIFFDNIGVYAGGMGYAGLASVGGSDLWIQQANDAGIYVHELGHNYGLGHASLWQASGASPIGAGTSVEYGDRFDIMGSGPVDRGYFHPQAKARLNWLTTAQWTDATASGSGTHRLYRIDSSATVGAPRGVRITKAATAGAAEYYWLGFRPAFGENPAFARGASLLWQRPGEDRSWLLDSTPGSAAGLADSPLALGRTYSDTAAGVHITPLSVGGSGPEQYLDVRVNLGAFPGNHSPVLAPLSGPATVAARTPASFTASATDSDSDSLAYGWDTGDGLPGNNSGTVSHSWIVGGTYSLSLTVSDMKGGTATAQRSVTVTDPLNTWTGRTAATTDDLLEIVAGKGRLVAANYWGQISLSWDGTTWSAAGSVPGFESQPQLAFGDHGFVLAGKKSGADAGQIGFSADGLHWQVSTFPSGIPKFNDVASNGSTYLAVASSGAVLRSTDAANWSVTTVPGLPDFRHVIWDGAAWLAVSVEAGAGWPRLLWTSSDGATWTRRAAFTSDIFGLQAAGGTAYAMGWYGGLKYSTDHGLTWLEASLPLSTAWTTHRLATASDGTLLLSAQAMDESGSPAALLVSTDGRTWTRALRAEPVAQLNDLAFGAGRFIAVGNAAAIRTSDSLFPGNAAPVVTITAAPATATARQSVRFAATATDADGDPLTFSWDCGPQNPVLDGAEITPSFSFGGSITLTLRVSDGRGGLTTVTRAVEITDPARTWTQRSSGVSATLTALAASPSLLVAAGDNGALLTSTNAATWIQRSLPDWGGNIYLRAATWDGTRFIIAGEDYNNGWVSVLYTSTDGTSWTRRYKSTTPGTWLQSVASSGSIGIAVGISGEVLRSTDYITWTPVAVAALGSADATGVAWGDGRFTLVVGESNAAKVLTSTDGLTWIDRSSGVDLGGWQYFEKITWLQDRFVASGWYSQLRVSTDGGQSFTTTRAGNESCPALASGDGIWLAAGANLDDNGKQIDLLSLNGAEWSSYPAPAAAARHAAVFFKHTFVTVGDGGTIWQSDPLVTASGWAAWQAVQFPGGGPQALPDADPDSDGLSNRLEYALGRLPLSSAGSDGASAFPEGVISAGRPVLRLSLPEVAPADVVYIVQGSANLAAGSWTTLARKSGTGAWQWLGGGAARIAVAPPANGRVIIEVGRPESADSAARYFLRLALEAP